MFSVVDRSLYNGSWQIGDAQASLGGSSIKAAHYREPEDELTSFGSD
jgi:hypothetical protein